MSEKLKSMQEYIRLRPHMYGIAIYPGRTLFKYLLSVFAELHLRGRTKKIQVIADRECIAIRCFGGGLPFSTLRRLPSVNAYRAKRKWSLSSNKSRGCVMLEEDCMLSAAAFGRKFRVSSVHGGRKIICSDENQQGVVCRETTSTEPPGSELYLELDTAFLNSVYPRGDVSAGFEPEYIRYLLDEKNALYPNCEFMLNEAVLPPSMGLFDLLFRASEMPEELNLLGSISCHDGAVSLAVAYDRYHWSRGKGASVFFFNGCRWCNEHDAFSNSCSHPFPDECRKGIESGVADAMKKIRGRGNVMEKIHLVSHLQTTPDEEEKCSYENHRRNIRSSVYWALLHELFPRDEGSPTATCFKNKQQSFAEFQKSTWRRLDPLDKESLLLTKPEFFDLMDDPQRELAPDRWLAVLACQPQFEKYFDWSKVEKHPSNEWDFLLRRQPQFADHCDFSQLRSDQIRRILNKQPQLIERCNWSKLTPEDRAKLEAKGIKP